MSSNKIIFINPHAAMERSVEGKTIRPEYRDLSKVFACGPIDRTGTLETGFDYKVLDKIPEPILNRDTFCPICDLTGEKLVQEAITLDKKIQVLWSGGIDSTAALISLLKAREKMDFRNIEVLLSIDSVTEYPFFYKRYVSKEKVRIVSHPISKYIDPYNSLVVTGELGDQLFGSDKVLDFVESGIFKMPYQDIAPLVFHKKLESISRVDALMQYMEPQIQKSPYKIKSLFDLMWWMNFSLKWQQVVLRLVAFRYQDPVETYNSLRHFYRGDEFQIWSITHPDNKIWNTSTSYKKPAKKYIYSFTDDQKYFDNKKKKISLQPISENVKEIRGDRRVKFIMREDMKVIHEIICRKSRSLEESILAMPE